MSASLAGDVAAVDGFFTRFNVDPVAGFHLINGTAGVVMKLAGVAVSDIGECGGTDKDQDDGKGKNTFHRRLLSVECGKLCSQLIIA